MPARSSPTVKRRRLAAELRRHREAASLTIDEVAESLEWSSAKISRIENARVGVLPRDVKFLLTTYGLTRISTQAVEGNFRPGVHDKFDVGVWV